MLWLLCFFLPSSLTNPVRAVAGNPVFKPATEEHEELVKVHIVSSGATAVYYTLDGTDPKESDTKRTYTAPFEIVEPGPTEVRAVAVDNVNAWTEEKKKTYVVVKVFEGVATVGDHLTACVVGLDPAGGRVGTDVPGQLFRDETATTTTDGRYRIRSKRHAAGGVVLDAVTPFASDACADTATGKAPALPLTTPCGETLTPLTTAASAAMAAGGFELATAVAATAAVVGVPSGAPICGFNDAPRRALDGDPLGIASLARAAQVQSFAAYAAAAIHGISNKRVSVHAAGVAAFSALGTEIARRHAASSGRRRRRGRRSLLAASASSAKAMNWVDADELKGLLQKAAAALEDGSLPEPWGTGAGAETVGAVERLLHADAVSLDALAKELTPTASDLAKVQGVVATVSMARFDDIVAVGSGTLDQLTFDYKYNLRSRPSPPPPRPPPPTPPVPPSPPPAFRQVGPFNKTVGGVPIWVFIVIGTGLACGALLYVILHYRRVRKGRKARGESDPDFGDDLRSPTPRQRKDQNGKSGGLEEDFKGINPTMGSGAAMAAAEAGGEGGLRSAFARPDLVRPGVLARKDGAVSGVFARPDLIKSRGEGGGVENGNSSSEARGETGDYDGGEATKGSYDDDTGASSRPAPMLRWDPDMQSWTRERIHSGNGDGVDAPGSIASPAQPKSVSFGRPPSMRLKKEGISGVGGGGGLPQAPVPPKKEEGAFVRRAAPMNPSVIDAMSRREVVAALTKRGVEHDDLLETDATDDELKQRLKLHACANRDQMAAAEASANEATRREFQKTLNTPADEWF